MPIYEVTDPQTGLTLELEGETPPTESELEQIFSTYQSPPQQDPAYDPTAGMSTAEKALVGFGGGMVEKGKGLQQTYHDIAGNVEESARLGQEIAEGRKIMEPLGTPGKVGQVGSDFAVAAGIPGGTTVKGAAAVGGLLGLTAPMEESSREARLMGGGLGLGMAGGSAKIMNGMIGLAARRRAGKDNIKAAAQEVERLAKQYDVPMSYGDIRGTGSLLEDMLTRVPVVGTRRFRRDQAKAATRSIDDFVNKWGDKDANLDTIIAQSAGTKLGKHQTILSKFYDDLEREFGDTAIPTSRFESTVDRFLLQTKNSEMRKLLTDWKSQLTNQPQGLTPYQNLSSAPDSIRKQIADAIGKNSLAGADNRFKGPLVQLKQALTDDIKEAAMIRGGDLWTNWQKANAFAAKHTMPFKKGGEYYSIFKGISDETKVMDRVISMLKSRNPVQARTIWRALNPSGRQAARMALYKEALKKAHTDTGGMQRYNPVVFKKEMDKYMESGFFRGSHKTELEGFTKLLSHMDRTAQALVNPQTGIRLSEWMFAGGAMLAYTQDHAEELGTGAAAAGLASMLLTTPRGRQMLLRARTAKTPEAMAKVIKGITQQIPKWTATTPREWLQGALPEIPQEAEAQLAVGRPVPMQAPIEIDEELGIARRR
jgi:hypothetical protein